MLGEGVHYISVGLGCKLYQCWVRVYIISVSGEGVYVPTHWLYIREFVSSVCLASGDNAESSSLVVYLYRNTLL